MEAGTSVSHIPTPMPSLWLRRDTIILFVPFTVRLLIVTNVSWAMTIPCWDLNGKNASVVPKVHWEHNKAESHIYDSKRASRKGSGRNDRKRGK